MPPWARAGRPAAAAVAATTGQCLSAHAAPARRMRSDDCLRVSGPSMRRQQRGAAAAGAPGSYLCWEQRA